MIEDSSVHAAPDAKFMTVLSAWQALSIFSLCAAIATGTFPTVVLAQASLENYQQQAFSFPGEIDKLIIADLNGDSAKDIVTAQDTVLKVYFQHAKEQTFDFAAPTTIDLPGAAVGWDVSDGYGEWSSLLALVDGERVLRWQASKDSLNFAEAELVHENLSGYLPQGVNRLRFNRDINSDGMADLLIPGAGVVNLFIRNRDGSYQPRTSIQSNVLMNTQLNSGRLERNSGQSLRIPPVVLRDVNNDGANDLVSNTTQQLDVFLAQTVGDRYFSREPSYSVELPSLEQRLGQLDFDSIDFSNLTGVLAITSEEILEDINGDGIADLLMRDGGKVTLFAGTPTGMDLDQPQQVLRSSGNVLTAFLYDEDGDALKDLWLWRVESISVGDIFVWLALSGSVDVEAFVYLNQGERFARRPSRKVTVSLRFPSVLNTISTISDLEEEAEALEDSPPIPHAEANLDEQTNSLELLVLANEQLRVFMNRINQTERGDQFLGSLNYSRERDNYEIDLKQLFTDAILETNESLDLIAGQEPDAVVELGQAVALGDVITVNLNDDELQDLFVFSNSDAGLLEGLLLISKSR